MGFYHLLLIFKTKSLGVKRREVAQTLLLIKPELGIWSQFSYIS